MSQLRSSFETEDTKHIREIVVTIRASFTMNDRTYGSPRISRLRLPVGRHLVLAEHSIACSMSRRG
jgi:hypothetical protein